MDELRYCSMQFSNSLHIVKSKGDRLNVEAIAPCYDEDWKSGLKPLKVGQSAVAIGWMDNLYGRYLCIVLPDGKRMDVRPSFLKIVGDKDYNQDR